MYVRARRTSRTKRIGSLSPLQPPVISGDGRYLLHAPNDTTGPWLMLRDLRTGTDEVVANQPASAGPDAVSAWRARRGLPAHGRRHRAR
ncbi:hypothetical protein [Streptomyces spectabilis]|uniref:hypothetical protein n=1 Tax=Streptomyces spectabilis TaxID=68270 RepID=UPI00298EDD00|nr:hypothetical protein [Streptomyces spectabilis]